MHSDCLPPSLIEDVDAWVTRKRIKSWLFLNLLINDIINYALSGFNTSFLSLRHATCYLLQTKNQNSTSLWICWLSLTTAMLPNWHIHTHGTQIHCRHTHTRHKHVHTQTAHAISRLEMFWCILKPQSDLHIISGTLFLEGNYFLLICIMIIDWGRLTTERGWITFLTDIQLIGVAFMISPKYLLLVCLASLITEERFLDTKVYIY